MVRKIILIISAMLLLISGIAGSAAAESFTTYDGNLSSSYITYFRDILSNADIRENYVVFRSGQNDYLMVTGDLNYNNGVFTLNESGKKYSISNSSSNYNGFYIYDVSAINDFTLNVGNKIVYSDLGDFPQLEERNARYEIIQTLTIVIIGLCFVIRSIFSACKR